LPIDDTVVTLDAREGQALDARPARRRISYASPTYHLVTEIPCALTYSKNSAKDMRASQAARDDVNMPSWNSRAASAVCTPTHSARIMSL
jgi:hypothetical protein